MAFVQGLAGGEVGREAVQRCQVGLAAGEEAPAPVGVGRVGMLAFGGECGQFPGAQHGGQPAIAVQAA